ncbi:MAG TPA: MXAN_6640 family putative metalloprotease, partial [Nocardioides sp.]
RAELLVAGEGPAVTATGEPESPTLALRDLMIAKPKLRGAEREAADRLLARPTDGIVDPGGDGYPAGSVVKSGCTGGICVHYVDKAQNPTIGATPAWASQTAQIAKNAYGFLVNSRGYRPAPSDGTRGGNANLDIYLTDLASQGLYGYCAPEQYVAGSDYRATSYCVLDNDYVEFLPVTPVNALRVTAVHEIFHAIQFGYDLFEDAWLYEATATWMEEVWAPDVNDNRQYLGDGQLARPLVPLDAFDDASGNSYGNWLFFEYLEERFGANVVRAVWEKASATGSVGHHSMFALRTVLSGLRDAAGRPTDLGKEYAGFAGANQIPASFYDDGAAYTATPVNAAYAMTNSTTPIARRFTVPQQTSYTVRFQPAFSAASQRYRLRLRFSTPAAATTPGAFVVVEYANGTVARGAIGLQAGTTTQYVAFQPGQVRNVYVSFVNASSRFVCGQDTVRACAGTPVDNSVGYYVDALAQRY